MAGTSILAVFLLLAFCMPVSAYSSDASAWFMQGNTLLQSGNYSAAVSAYDHAISLEPGYYEAWNAKADALNRAAYSDARFNQTVLTGALAASNTSLSIDPVYTQGWINRGQILYNVGLFYENQVHDINTSDEYYNDELLAYNKAIEIDPNNADAWFNKGFALGGMERYDEAIAAFDKVQSINPQYPRIAYYRTMAEQLRDAATPFYIRYAFVIIAVIVVAAGAVLWFVAVREKS
ncbi:MAG: tetratricopeptide repeat protein [Methanoregula sp.]|uniref:tetratricopeptide repeat protein n=1 Tax=Methanoregula sp. TaxID=2052170 RepID=UPI003D0F080B